MGGRSESPKAARLARLAACAIALAAALASLPTTASAATVAKDGANLNFNAAAGEVNRLTVSLAGGAYTVDDPGAALTPGAGCTVVDANTATCPAAGITRIVALGGNMDDVLSVTAATGSTLFGVEGNDTLVGSGSDDVLVGCTGDDTMVGGGGPDIEADALFCPGGGANQFIGGGGNDTLHGGPDGDTFDAGAGDDDLRAQDGAIDSVNCGAGSDVGAADFDDLLNPDCEDLALTIPPPEDEDFFFEELGFTECLPDDVPPEDVEALEDEGFQFCLESGRGPCSSLRIRGRRANMRGGEVAIRVSLARSAGGVCRAKLKLEALVGKRRLASARARRVRLGSEAFSLRPGRSKSFAIDVSRAGRRLVQRRGRLPLRVAVLSRGEKIDSAVLKLSAGR